MFNKIQNLKFKNQNHNLKLKIFLIILNFGLSFWILVFGFWISSFAQDKIVAIVNSDIITQKDLNDFINFMHLQLRENYKGEELETKIQSMKLDLLDRLIEDRLILQEAKKKIEVKPNVWIGMEPDENKVKARMDEIKKRYPTEVEFQRALSQQGLTQADIELKIKEQLLMYNIIEYKIRSKIVIKPSEVTEFYQENIQQFKTTQQREVTSISIKDENLANDIYNRLIKGDDLNKIINEQHLTTDKIMASQNEELRKDIEDAIFKLNINQISQPLKINAAFYIFRLDEIIPSHQQNLAEAQERIYTYLFEQKLQEGLSRWLDEIKKDSYIEILQN